MVPEEPRWVDPGRIAALEDRVRAEQEEVLADVLSLFDQLTGLFMPSTETVTPKTPGVQVRALIMLESGLFGHLRSARTAVRDGRVQDVAALVRTVGEIRKKSALCIADQEFAGRVAAGTEISMAELDRRFASLRELEGRPPRAEHDHGDRLARRAASAVIHATVEGLGFMAVATPDGTGIVRDPGARRMPDRGRFGAVLALSLAAFSVGTLVPALHVALGQDAGPWWRRWARFDEELRRVVEPYAIRVAVHDRDPGRVLTISARGELLEGGRPLGAEEIAELRRMLEHIGV